MSSKIIFTYVTCVVNKYYDERKKNLSMSYDEYRIYG